MHAVFNLKCSINQKDEQSGLPGLKSININMLTIFNQYFLHTLIFPLYKMRVLISLLIRGLFPVFFCEMAGH